MCCNELIIAIIDDGVNEKLYNIDDLTYNIEVTSDLNIINRTSYNQYEHSHGTTCAAIIKKYVPKANLASIKILNEKDKGNINQLIKAIDWCIKKNIKLINLSLGTINHVDFEILKKYIDYACKQGIVIIAACNNKNIYTCPASFPNVIGVKCDRFGILKENEYIYNTSWPDGIEIISNSSHLLIDCYNHHIKTSLSNSFATPCITSIVYFLMEEFSGITLKEIKERLRRNSVNNPKAYRLNIGSIYDGCNNFEEIPVVIIKNFILDRKINMYSGLRKLFKENGYNALVVRNSNKKIKDDFVITPLKKFKAFFNAINYKTLQTLYGIYIPDIFIVHYDIYTKKDMKLKKDFDVDIVIIIAENYDEMVKKELRKNKYSKALLILCNKSKLNTYKNIYEEQIYNYIRNCF